MQMLDNSDAAAPRLIAFGRVERPLVIVDESGWNKLMEHAR